VRRLRAQLKSGAIDRPTYERLIDQQIALAIGIQVGGTGRGQVGGTQDGGTCGCAACTVVGK
jgi:hypothetical protein